METIQLSPSELSAIEGEALYDWQVEALEAFQVGWPLALVAANGSGKTAKVAASAVRWFFRKYPQGQMVCTSGSFNQLQNQLWPNVRLRIPECYKMSASAPLRIVGPDGSLGVGFSTNNAGRAEGWHPKKGPDIDPVMILIDEGKTVPDAIWTAFDRCTVKYFMAISSPGPPRGRFFECFNTLSKYYYKVKATSLMCPHIPKWKRDRDEQIMSAVDFDSTHNAEFSLDGEHMIISSEALRASLDLQPPPSEGGEKVAAFDFARGRDENVFALRIGNKVRIVEAWQERDAVKAVRKFIRLAKDQGIQGSHCWGDADGLGGPMIDIFKSEGFAINEFRGGTPGLEKDDKGNQKFGNLISECWIKTCLKIEQLRINLGELDQLSCDQLSNRLFLWDEKGRQIAEPKKKMLADRGVKSPDRGDAICMATMCGSHMTGSITAETASSSEVAESDFSIDQVDF